MLRASLRPSSGATTTAVAASGLPPELGDSSAVSRVRAGRPTRCGAECMRMYLHPALSFHGVCRDAFTLLVNVAASEADVNLQMHMGTWEPTKRMAVLTHSGRGHLNCLNARSRGF